MHLLSPMTRLRALALVALLGPLPAATAAVYGFLDQGAVRYFNTEDTQLMSATIDAVLEAPADGEARTWRNENTGSHGSVTALRSFRKNDMPCRRIEIRNHARGTDDRSIADLCRVDGAWKVLGMPE
jgi:surface antigen